MAHRSIRSRNRGKHGVPCPRGAWLTLLTVVAAALSAAVLVTGCASPSHEQPQSRPLDAPAVGLPAFVAPMELRPDWWKEFGDPVLDALVDRALAGNPTLRVAEARVRRARADSDAAAATEAPRLEASGHVTRQRFTENGLMPPPIAGSIRTDSLLQLSGSWDLDLFGRDRALLEAAIGARRAAEADAAMARLVLAAGVSESYLQLAGLLRESEVLQRAVQQRERILALVEQRVRTGLDSEVERRQAEGAVPEARVRLRDVQDRILRARHALAALTAQAPQATASLRPRMGAAPAGLPATLPADLLARRPDVAAARAEFYPSVNLVAFAGLSSISFGHLLEAGSRQFGIGPAVHLPLFDGGRLRANYAGRTADVDIAVEDYNRTVLEAVRDAADRIGTLQSLQLQAQDQSDATRSAARAYDLGTVRYGAGLGNYLSVLGAEGNLLKQQLQQAGLDTRLQLARIALVRALGGGYTQPR